jgi:hypothetical protein
LKISASDEWLIAGGLIVAILAAAYFSGSTFNDTGAQVNNPGVAQPSPGNNNSVTNTYPENVTFTIPSNANTGNGTSCSCGCNNAASFATLQSLEATFTSQLQNVENQYIQAIQAGLPSFVKQFLNNATGWAEGLAAQSQGF